MSIVMQHSFKRPVALIISTGLALLALALLPSTSRAAIEVCPNSFHVLHDDRIGQLSLPKGHYRITLLKKNKPLTCDDAAFLFRKFLEDYDGKLQGRWRVVPKSATFKRGGSGVGFRVRRRGGGGGKHPAKGGKRCPNTFAVQHDDRIGKLRLKKGDYHYTRLNRTSPSCARIPTLFAKFLEDFDGNLPKPWRLNANRGAFIKKGSGGEGFRVKPVR